MDGFNSFTQILIFHVSLAKKDTTFLDLNVSLENITDLEVKPTNCNQYLHYFSCHPAH